MECICRLWEKEIVKQYLVEQLYDAASAIEKIVHLENDVVRYVSIVLIAAWAGNAKIEHLIYREP